jgi:hypothetical protein
VAGAIIRYAGDRTRGYHIVFALVLATYLAAFLVSFFMPADATRRPFRIGRALFPGKDQRDWRLVMLASASLAGTFSIFAFLLSMIMYTRTSDELSVGGYVSLQLLAAVVVAFYVGRVVTPETRLAYMRFSVIVLVAAGAIMLFRLSVTTLILFGILRSIAQSAFGIPHAGLRFDVITESAEDPSQRIEYLAAWEVPLALGRVAMMVLLLVLYGALEENELGLRIMLFLLCAVRVVTYLLLARTSCMKNA